MIRLRSITDGFLSVLYPNLCTSCGESIAANTAFCVTCLGKLPFTEFSTEPDNLFERHFWGRVDIQAGASLLFYIPGGLSQNLLHNIKYRNRPDFGRRAGHYFGTALANGGRFDNIDGIIPVPLHYRKLQKRGYNQSYMIAKGMAAAMGAQVIRKTLLRDVYTESQTRKSRIERIDNLKGCFRLRNASALAGKSILLVDDVLTTGATLEACAMVLKQAPRVKISMATLACGRI